MVRIRRGSRWARGSERVTAAGILLLAVLAALSGPADAAAAALPAATSGGTERLAPAVSAAPTSAMQACPDVTDELVVRGSAGNHVREVQCLLNMSVDPERYRVIDEDGDFGPDTEGKVMAFQSCVNSAYAAGLTIDGKAGWRTLSWLRYQAGRTEFVC